MKKIMVSTFSALLLMLVLTSTVSAAPAGERDHLRFKGTLQAVETSAFNPGPPPTVDAVGNGSGHGNHLGKFTYSYYVTIYLSPDGSGVGTTHYTFVAANGDTLISDGDGIGIPVPEMSGFNHVVEKHTILGGTGRFAGASGKFTIDRLANRATNLTSGTFDGYIVLAEDN